MEFIYWDSSAILSALFDDTHSAAAGSRLRQRGTHLISSLALAEVLAVTTRMERGLKVSSRSADGARRAVTRGPWRQTSVTPSAAVTQKLSQALPLRGADLWHLAAAYELRLDLPTLELLSYDRALLAAAQTIGLTG